MKKQNIYIYPAIFEEKNGGYNVSFPDIQGCFTFGDDLEEALFMAKEALELNMYDIEEDGKEIPFPSEHKDIKLKKNQFIQLIEVYMIPVRDEMENKRIKMNVTIPKWLVDLGKEKKIKFSSVLELALKEKLGIHKTEN